METVPTFRMIHKWFLSMLFSPLSYLSVQGSGRLSGWDSVGFMCDPEDAGH